MPVDAPDGSTIEVRAVAGDTTGNESAPPVLTTLLVGDQARPRVEILAPADGMEVFPGDTIALETRAVDDVGVRAIAFTASGALTASDARTFDGLSLNMAQRQLERFERAGALVSSLQGRTRLYTWNPRYAFRRELRALLRKALDQLPAAERRRYFTDRRRPRRTGKPR